jgi:hypothetical protein
MDSSSKLSREETSSLPPPDPKDYRAIVGSLIYAQTLTQMPISFAVTQLSKYLARPTHAHMHAAKRVLAYLYHHRHLGPTYDGNLGTSLVGYSDADYGGCPDTRRSTSGRVFMFMGAALTWASKQQRTVAVSTAESEYMAVSDCAREAMWVRKLIADLLQLDSVPVTSIMEDNTAASKWCYNPVNHAKQKHIDIAYHFVREQIAEFGTLTIVAVPTVEQIADLATKALPAPRFEYLVRKAFNISTDRSLRMTIPTELPKS